MTPTNLWASGSAYHRYIGRWSGPVARQFLGWLAVPSGAEWLDVGCGTGALAAQILATRAPARIIGIDPSPNFVEHARRSVPAEFQVGYAQELPFADSTFDVVVSGLVLNFVQHPDRAVHEAARVAKPLGTVAAYVWDLAGEMQLIRRLWDVATELDPAAAELDEGTRYPLCRPDRLAALFGAAGLTAVETRAIEVPTTFRDFDDYWEPFLGGQGPAPVYLASLDQQRRNAIRDRLKLRLPARPDGSIRLIARAWAARGQVPIESVRG